MTGASVLAFLDQLLASSRGRSGISALPRYGVLSAMAGLAVSGVYAARGLYADGSYHLLKILEQLGYWDYDKARTFGQYVLQAPVVLALHFGLRDLNQLVRLQSFGLIVIPLALWIAAVWMQIKSGLFWTFVTAFCVSYLTAGFMAVDEYNLAYAMTAFCVSVVLCDRIGRVRAVALVVGGLILVRTYPAMLFLAPILCAIAVLRLHQFKTDGRWARVALTLLACASIAAAVVSAWAIHAPRDPGNLANAANLMPAILSVHFLLVLVCSLVAMLMQANIAVPGRRVLTILCIALCMAYMVIPKWWSPPGMHYLFRTISGLMLAGSLAFAAWRFFKRRRLLDVPGASVHAAGAVAAFLFLALCVPMYAYSDGFLKWARALEIEMSGRSGFVTPESTATLKPRGWYSGYNWEWANPTLGLLLRGDTGAVLVNKQGYSGWQPYDPWLIKSNPLASFRKSGPLYRQVSP